MAGWEGPLQLYSICHIICVSCQPTARPAPPCVFATGSWQLCLCHNLFSVVLAGAVVAEVFFSLHAALSVSYRRQCC